MLDRTIGIPDTCVGIALTYNMHLLHIRLLGEDWGVSRDLTMVRTSCIEVNIFQLQLLFVGVFPLCEQENREENRFLTLH